MVGKRQLLSPVGAKDFQALVLIRGRTISCSATRCRSPILLNQLGNQEFGLQQLQPEIKFVFLTLPELLGEGEVTVGLLDNRNTLRAANRLALSNGLSLRFLWRLEINICTQRCVWFPNISDKSSWRALARSISIQPPSSLPLQQRLAADRLPRSNLN